MDSSMPTTTVDFEIVKENCVAADSEIINETTSTGNAKIDEKNWVAAD